MLSCDEDPVRAVGALATCTFKLLVKDELTDERDTGPACEVKASEEASRASKQPTVTFIAAICEGEELHGRPQPQRKGKGDEKTSSFCPA